MNNEEGICYCCGCTINDDTHIIINGKPYCKDCYFICKRCKKVTPVDDAYWLDDFMVCTECLNVEKLSKREEVL